MSNDLTVEDPNSPVGQISGTQQGLAEFAGPYVTEMLGKGMALADKPFDAYTCLLYTSPSPRDGLLSRMPSSA